MRYDWFKQFYFDSRKVPIIKDDVLTVKFNTVRLENSWRTMHDFFVVLRVRRFIVGASPKLKFRTTDKADTPHVVSGLPTARKPWNIVSPDFVQITTFLAYNASARHCLFWINAEFICRRGFHYSLSIALFLPKGARKAKVVWHLSMLL